MPSISLGVAFAALAAITSLVGASSTPAGFEPKVFPIVQVVFTRTRANPPGKSLKEGFVQKAPSLAIPESGSASYLAVMLDISVETADSTKNTTRLHWVQSNLTSQAVSGPALFSSTAPLVEYYAPGPPGGQSHTYVVLVYQQPSGWTLPADEAKALAKINAAVANRIDFDLARFVQAASLADPVAADYFLVTTYSQQTSSSAASAPTASGGAGETPTGKAVSGTDAGSGGPAETGVPSSAPGGALQAGNKVIGCAMGFFGVWASGLW